MSTVAAAESEVDQTPPELFDIRNQILALAELLPLQGPITAFAFLNPLQGMEDQPFVEALRQVSQVYGCEPFLSENRYRQKMARGRITVDDLREILREENGEQNDNRIGGIVALIDLRLSMLQHSVTPGNQNELRWTIAESDALRRFRTEMTHEVRDRLLEQTQHWIMRDLRSPGEAAPAPDHPEISRIVQQVVTSFGRSNIERWTDETWEQVTLDLLWKIILTTTTTTPAPRRTMHREALIETFRWMRIREDTDILVHEVLIRFCAAYLDQGYAQWRLPDRDAGFLASFALFQSGGFGNRRLMRPLATELRKSFGTAVFLHCSRLQIHFVSWESGR
ncbi:MAG: putative inorganic carbon transporter subunit DabA [Planctomycetaceae bacterium]